MISNNDSQVQLQNTNQHYPSTSSYQIVPPSSINHKQPSTTILNQDVSSLRRRRLQKATEKSLPIVAYNKAKKGMDLLIKWLLTSQRCEKVLNGTENLPLRFCWEYRKHMSHKKIHIRTFREELATGF